MCKRVVITGATSFIGMAVTKKLISDGLEVIAVVREDSDKIAMLQRIDKLNIVICDLNNIADLKNKIDKADIFIHFAWSGIGSKGRQDKDIQDKNIENTMIALKTAKYIGCDKFIFAGSQSEYGMVDGCMSEEIECNPVSEYAKAKLTVCNRASELSKEIGIQYIHLRIFSVYGAQDHPWSLISSCIDTFENGGELQLSECTQKWNYLYIDDLAEVYSRIVNYTSKHNEIFNVASDDIRVLREYIEEIYKISAKKGTYVFGERKSNAEGNTSLIPNMEKLKKAINWNEKVSFEEGIRKIIAERKEAADEK